MIEIIIIKQELLHDIETEIHGIERHRHLQETPIITNEDNRYSACRDIDTALNKVIKRCQAYHVPNNAHHIAANHTKDWHERSIFLAIPDWPHGNLDALRDAVHNYIVKSVVFSMLSVALPGDAYLPIVSQQRDDAYDDINVLINARNHRIVIHPTFLG